MKDQYAADIGDYGKYALLRAFARENVCVGINWYYTSDDKSNDGRFKEYLEDEKRFESYCEEVFAILRSIPKEQRTVKTIEESGIIPNACFYRDTVEFDGTPAERRSQRIDWAKKGQKQLASAGLVYFDPDNGLLTNEKLERRTAASKYVLPAEIETCYEEGKNIVYYCHKGRRKDSAWEDYKAFVLRRLPGAKPFVLTYHKGTQRSYVFLVHPKEYEKYKCIIESVVEAWKGAFSLESIKDPIIATMHSFACKWRDIFRENYDYHMIFASGMFPDDARNAGLVMDAWRSVKEVFPEVRSPGKLDSLEEYCSSENLTPYVLGAAIFSNWRYFNHWADAEPSKEDREWFIRALERLTLLTEACLL